MWIYLPRRLLGLMYTIVLTSTFLSAINPAFQCGEVPLFVHGFSGGYDKYQYLGAARLSMNARMRRPDLLHFKALNLSFSFL